MVKIYYHLHLIIEKQYYLDILDFMLFELYFDG